MRYIDADKLKAYKFHPLPYTHIVPADVEIVSYKRGWNDALDAIMTETPTADVRENVKGEWIDEGQYAEGHSHHSYYCSVCEEHYIGYIGEYNFCPNCGADMRGEG